MCNGMEHRFLDGTDFDLAWIKIESHQSGYLQPKWPRRQDFPAARLFFSFSTHSVAQWLGVWFLLALTSLTWLRLENPNTKLFLKILHFVQINQKWHHSDLWWRRLKTNHCCCCLNWLVPDVTTWQRTYLKLVRVLSDFSNCANSLSPKDVDTSSTSLCTVKHEQLCPNTTSGEDGRCVV